MQIASNQLMIDSTTPIKFIKSPNYGEPLLEKAFIIMHYTGGASPQSSAAWLCDPASQVSSHLVIGRDGSIVQLVPFDTTAWHAGQSAWGTYTKLNSYSVGIELDNAGMMTRSGSQWLSNFGKIYPDSEVQTSPHKSFPNVMYAWHKYTDVQLKVAADVVAALIRTYGFREILGHDDIAPKRKWDPGPAFPMEKFRLDVAALVSATNPTPTPNPMPVPTPTPIPNPEPTPTPTPDQQGNKPMHYKVENMDTGQKSEYTWSTAFKPVVLLPVPYISQLGQGADNHHNDCGAASAVMLLAAYLNLQITPDEFYTKFAIVGDPFLSVTQLRNAMGSLGVLTDFRATLLLQDLFAALAARKAPIVLLRYKVLHDAGLTEKSFEGPHFAVVVGMDVKNIYIHDPLYTNPTDGAAHTYPLDIFWKAWKDVANDPQYPNPERSAIIPTAGIGFRMARKVKINTSSLYVRSGPAGTFAVVASVKKDDVLDVTRELNGWGEIGENRWIVLSFTLPT